MRVAKGVVKRTLDGPPAWGEGRKTSAALSRCRRSRPSAFRLLGMSRSTWGVDPPVCRRLRKVMPFVAHRYNWQHLWLAMYRGSGSGCALLAAS